MDSLFIYIDPGTGSLLVSALVALGVSLIYSIKGFVYRVLSRFTGKKIGISPDFSGKLVFYSEGSKYWRIFKPVLDELSRQQQGFVFLTSDPADPGLKYWANQEELCNRQSQEIEAHFIGTIQQAIPFLNRLKAAVVIMTTPQLDVLQLKRSPDVTHYCHIVHAPIDMHTYKFYAFDEFDSVLCCSKSQISNLRFLEDLRQGKKKQLFETGCTYYDEISAQYKDAIEQNKQNQNVILYAPTWGDKSSLPQAKELMLLLLDANYSVIFRPHPQSWISDQDYLEGICQYFEGQEQWADRWSLDKEPGFDQAFARCAVLLCDLSGVVYDFAFLYQKPVFAFDTSDSLQVGYEAYYLEQEISAIPLLQATSGRLLQLEDVTNVADILKQTEQTISEFTRADFIFHFQNAGKVAAQQILSIQEQI